MEEFLYQLHSIQSQPSLTPYHLTAKLLDLPYLPVCLSLHVPLTRCSLHTPAVSMTAQLLEFLFGRMTAGVST
jgi:hypothetical protein